MCTPSRAIAVRPQTTLLFSTGIDLSVRDGVPLTTAPSKGTPGNVLWTGEVGGLFALLSGQIQIKVLPSSRLFSLSGL